MEKMFKKYQNLMRKMAWKATRKWRIEYEEAEAQAYLIFCESLKKWDKNKSHFSTFLSIQLKGYLDLYFKKYKIELANKYEIENEKDIYFQRFCSILEFYDQIATELQNDARDILNYILNNYGVEKMSKARVIRYFKSFYSWTGLRISKAWYGIEDWWLQHQGKYSLEF